MDYVIDFAQISLAMQNVVGGKNASLGEMINHLSHLGIKVPAGFATTADAYREFLAQQNLKQKIASRLLNLNINDLNQLQLASQEIRQWILANPLPENLTHAVQNAYQQLITHPDMTVAVRSSATAEDTVQASFAGQQETFLNIKGIDNVLMAIKKVYASLFSERAIAYRVHQGFDHQQVAISVGIQRMVRSDLGASGVVFTLDTESGFDQVVFITAAYGLGESIVQGNVNPDEFYVHKPMLRSDKPAIISRTLGSKNLKIIYAPNNTETTLQTVEVPPAEQKRFCITDAEIIQLAQQALLIEEHYKKPMDIEWGKDGVDNQIYILQARPETVKGREKHHILEQYHLHEKSEPKVFGRSIGQRIGQGAARLIENPREMHAMIDGEILVTDMTDPDWEPIMKRASAIVTNRGGRTCHAAIIARELGIPAVVGCIDATDKIQNGETITVSCAEGETGYVYSGLLKFEVKTTPIAEMPVIPFNISMNLANPEQAFTYQFLPNDGVGLARLEFIIGNMIGIHPNACLKFSSLPSALQEEIRLRTDSYGSPAEFYIERLCEGIATIAAAFYPKPIIVRFSDFKSNEYANLLGGSLFEPHEENPMIGYRGASRYLSGNFRECFLLECEAIKRVRDKLGLINTQIMFPFVRTLTEAQQLIELIATQGLERGKDGLKVYMMCEIPSNVLLAKEFLAHFDGFSIGSNDLTQLTLGLDRDSALISNLFDERDPAVKSLLRQAIRACKELNKYVGICGQGPSDHLDLAKWLMNEGIASLSLSPDTVVQTWLALARDLSDPRA